MTKKSNKNVYIAAFVLLLGALGFLLFSGLSQNSVYFLEVSEALAMESDSLGAARLFGTVDGEGISRDPQHLGVTFRLLDSKDTSKGMWVTYKGAVPDTFKAGVEVIVEGAMPKGSRTFNATMLMTKCPSKYEKDNREG
jgi:cytochrome c-type biogenesis protein CcmE